MSKAISVTVIAMLIFTLGASYAHADRGGSRVWYVCESRNSETLALYDRAIGQLDLNILTSNDYSDLRALYGNGITVMGQQGAARYRIEFVGGKSKSSYERKARLNRICSISVGIADVADSETPETALQSAQFGYFDSGNSCAVTVPDGKNTIMTWSHGASGTQIADSCTVSVYLPY